MAVSLRDIKTCIFVFSVLLTFFFGTFVLWLTNTSFFSCLLQNYWDLPRPCKQYIFFPATCVLYCSLILFSTKRKTLVSQRTISSQKMYLTCSVVPSFLSNEHVLLLNKQYWKKSNYSSNFKCEKQNSQILMYSWIFLVPKQHRSNCFFLFLWISGRDKLYHRD